AAALAGVAGRVPPQTLVGLALFAACYFALLARSARPAGLRWPVAALFGLVHGLGFAGVLAEMTLPRARLVPALLGFNVGVELGQLAAVAAAWPVLDLLARRGEPWRAAVVGYGSAGVLAMGVLWFAGRAFG
ncbi:MAG: HupE/UreJ family protein, partial [Chloroflexi bacterium]